MTEPDRHLSLELTQAAASIRGRLRDEHGHVRTFSSWLGLLAALNAAIPGTDTATRQIRKADPASVPRRSTPTHATRPGTASREHRA